MRRRDEERRVYENRENGRLLRNNNDFEIFTPVDDNNYFSNQLSNLRIYENDFNRRAPLRNVDDMNPAFNNLHAENCETNDRATTEHDEDCSKNPDENPRENPMMNNIRTNRRQIDFSFGITNARSL